MRGDAMVGVDGTRQQYAGTYACCLRAGGGWRAAPEIQILLYLLPSGRFHFAGAWPGYELTVIVGHWKAAEDGVALRGVGRCLQHDVLPLMGAFRPCACRLAASGAEASPVLVAGDDLRGWGLFGRVGSLHYLGLGRVLPLEDTGLPESWSAIAPWIDQFLGIPN
jgi:hypothetical protein